MLNSLKREIFIYLFTSRRNFWPLIALLYLQVPWAEVVHLWYFLVAESLTWLLIEIPTWYMSDRFWYKNTLILGKICMVCSTICLIIWGSLVFFLLANVLMSIALACKSWTIQAYIHDSLQEQNMSEQFWAIMAKIKWDVSLLSLFFIFWFPFLFAIDPLYPFYVVLCLDIWWLLFSCLLENPTSSVHAGDEMETYLWMRKVFWLFLWSKDTLLVTFVMAIYGVIFFTSWSFSDAFLVDIWYPVMYIGVVMWLSRLIWFILWRSIWHSHRVFTLREMLLLDIVIIWWWFLSIWLLWVPWYLVWLIFSCVIGYYRARKPLYTHILLKCLPDMRYKATFLSIQGQLKWLLWVVFPLMIWLLMTESYHLWYIVIWWISVLLGVGGYVLSKRYMRVE